MSAKSKSKPKPAPTKTAASKTAPPQLTDTFRPGFWQHNWMPVLLLMALAFGLYAMSIGFGYVLDDEMVIHKNVYVMKGFAGLREIFGADSFMGYFQKKEQLFLLEGGRYRPLSLATFAMEVGIFGKDSPNLPHISHFINILLYGLTGVLLYRILLGLFPLKEGGRWYFGLPFLAAAIFVLHPLHTEAVANIK
ncbi:MAG TPA: tetratricopeptide repeat protein, partial [Saprospiraceae bacterium]|nr:tetratricopeptide repeat protein [Saprospiraceae bacterium]